jgi:hypothetical protein
VFEFVFLIPLMGIGLGFFGVWTHHRQKMVRLQIQLANAKGTNAASPDRTHEINDLRERVRVLERIVTDGGYDLASKIEALRDERPLPRAIKQAEAEPLG